MPCALMHPPHPGSGSAHWQSICPFLAWRKHDFQNTISKFWSITPQTSLSLPLSQSWTELLTGNSECSGKLCCAFQKGSRASAAVSTPDLYLSPRQGCLRACGWLLSSVLVSLLLLASRDFCSLHFMYHRWEKKTQEAANGFTEQVMQDSVTFIWKAFLTSNLKWVYIDPKINTFSICLICQTIFKYKYSLVWFKEFHKNIWEPLSLSKKNISTPSIENRLRKWIYSIKL